MEEKAIMVSIHCLAFNHEKYIRKTLDGFVTQKTTFKFEVLIHDDASNDGTQSIIKEYEEKYPDIVKPIYQEINQYSKGVKVLKAFNLPRAKGKYIAYCEGDDFWCDEKKLQKQVDALEQNPMCSLCTHFVSMISENGQDVLGSIPATSLTKNGTGIVKSQEYLYYELINGWASQTSSFLVSRKYLEEFFTEDPSYPKKMLVGDLPMILYMLTKGDVYFFNEYMSCYRVGGNSSFRTRRKKNNFFSLRYFYSLINGIAEYNQYTNYQNDTVIKAYIVKQLDNIKALEQHVFKEYEPYYFQVVYRGKFKHIRYFIRRKLPHLYKFLLWIWKIANSTK